jgi:hypothetical protein
MRRVFGTTVIAMGLVAVALFGCNGKAGDKTPAAAPKHRTGHAHAEEGPHGGHLIELGNDEFHAELVHDEKATKITVYILDGQAKQGVPIDQPTLTLNLTVAGQPKQYKLAAMPQPSDKPNTASSFELVDEELCDALDAPSTKGRLSVTINGKQFQGEIEHHNHT